jgi:hypothetical protein
MTVLVTGGGENPYVAARARQELGWAPPFDAPAAIRRTVGA